MSISITGQSLSSRYQSYPADEGGQSSSYQPESGADNSRMNSLYQSHLFVTEPPSFQLQEHGSCGFGIFHDYSFGNQLQTLGIKTSLLQGFFSVRLDQVEPTVYRKDSH